MVDVMEPTVISDQLLSFRLIDRDEVSKLLDELSEEQKKKIESTEDIKHPALTSEEIKKLEQEERKREVLEMFEEAQREEREQQKQRTERARKEAEEEKKRKDSDAEVASEQEHNTKSKDEIPTAETHHEEATDEHKKSGVGAFAGKLKKRANTIKQLMKGKEETQQSNSTHSSPMLKTKLPATVKEGYLKKRGHLRKSWKTRWFALKLDGFYYYGDAKDALHKGHIPMNDILGVETVSSAEDLDKLKAPAHILSFFLFKIVTAKNDYYVAATTVEDRDEWVKLANDVLHLLKQNTGYNSL